MIVQVLGASNEYSLQEKDILGIILESGVENTFSKNVIKESKYLKKNILINNNIYGRKDLKDIFTFTIDSIDAKDLDDAISIELISNGDYKLYTHIADVSNYVKENSNIDLEAKKRSTSIYLSDRVIPMLPEDLSNDLCSLEPNTDKLTLTVEIIISAKGGNIISTKVYNSIINSNYRITYKDVNDIEKNIKKLGDKLEFNQIISKELIDKLLIASKLKEVILDNRNKNGILDFDFPETYISFDSKGKVNGINEYKRYESNKIIEAFMVITNEAIGKEFSFLPFLYRTHEAPNFEDLINLNEKLNFFGIDFQIKENTTKEFALLLKKIDCLTKGKKLYIQKQVLRTLTEANYSNINIGHFGLGIKFYSHFTSPIRRYPDLQIHRIIKEALNNKILDGGKKELKYSLDKNRLLHYKKILPEIATQSGEKERLAQKLEYKVRDYFIVEYYKKRVGEEFEGFISGMIPKGFFVELDNTAEGFVNIENGLFDEKLFTFISENTKKYTIGDVVKVRLIEVDKKLLRLNFELI